MSGHISIQSAGDIMIIWGLGSLNTLTLTIYTCLVHVTIMQERIMNSDSYFLRGFFGG